MEAKEAAECVYTECEGTQPRRSIIGKPSSLELQVFAANIVFLSYMKQASED
jgi:hypothetical protein